jgi:hypothetical protein
MKREGGAARSPAGAGNDNLMSYYRYHKHIQGIIFLIAIKNVNYIIFHRYCLYYGSFTRDTSLTIRQKT